MRRLPKTLGNFDCPQIRSIVHLAQTQSKRTLCEWSIAYAEKHLLPIYERTFSEDSRPRDALANAHGQLDKRVRFADAKETNNSAHNAATAAERHPAAQAAARAIAHASLTIHVSAHCMGIAFYGAAALAYDRLGLDAAQEDYLRIAQEAWAEMEDALRDISIAHEPAPANIDLRFWSSRIH